MSLARTVSVWLLVCSTLACPLLWAVPASAQAPSASTSAEPAAADGDAGAASDAAKQAEAAKSTAEPVSAPQPLTVGDLTIPTSELDTLLTPLPQQQLKIEVDTWFELVQHAARRVAEAELDVKRKARAKKEDAKKQKAAEDAAATPPPATSAAPEAEEKEKVEEKKEIETIAELHSRRTAMVDRFKVVLKAYKEKGGKIEEYEQYIAAVTGVTVHAEDVSSSWKTISAWVQSEEGGRRWLKNLAIFLGTLLVFGLLALLVGRLVRAALSRVQRWSHLFKDFAVSMARRGTMLAGLLIALSALEVEMGPVLALLGAAGFVIGFALQGTLGNLASGLMILTYRPFDVGDTITTSGVTGKVDSMNLFSTTILTLDNKVTIIPNNSVWSGVIINITGSETRRVDMTFGIGYNDDETRAASLLEEILQNDPLVLEEPEPKVALHELADSSVNFICRPWVKTEDYWEVYWRVTRTVKATFDREGISIPFPQRDVHLIQAPAAEA